MLAKVLFKCWSIGFARLCCMAQSGCDADWLVTWLPECCLSPTVVVQVTVCSYDAAWLTTLMLGCYKVFQHELRQALLRWPKLALI